ncbi:MAG: hypothetical protein Q8907_14665, partial [Bacteroidota bacterium]|nr:hypothetical protein [Bacteroidota bacterium]MDP4227903.1 hypothetical protein [Bacteroidota bacterium]MDP4275515.1 hypothetical protein [Bacteroidota bacterium]
MHIRLIDFSLLIVFILAPGFSMASQRQEQLTYYIDSDRGSDSNDGHSPDRAWRTLNKVNSFTFKTGDSILFRSGTVL